MIEKDGDIYELDGRKPFPINHGKCTELLKDVARITKDEFMRRDKNEINFNLIALVPNVEMD